MAEIENVKENVSEPQPPVENPAPETANVEKGPSKGAKVWAAVKEWGRKQVVNLKRHPQNIGLVILLASTIFFMLALFVISQSVQAGQADKENTSVIGLMIFISTLLSLLVLVSYLNAFPKRKKPNVFFIVLVFVMIVAMIVCDSVYYFQMMQCLSNITDKEGDIYVNVSAGQPFILVHIVLLAVSAVVFALVPVYKRLINKINTRVELESATENMHGKIDLQED